MDKQKQSLIETILGQLYGTTYIQSEDIPKIDLYMDQVTSLMESHLGGLRRRDEDKVLTKTMINNYTKNKLIPSPDKKKYSREHIMLLVFIYYMKGFLSLDDIKAILEPVSSRFFSSGGNITIEDIYNEVSALGSCRIDPIHEDIREVFRIASESFPEAGEEDRDFLQIFSFICMLCQDIYLRRQMIEQLIDSLQELK